MKVLTKEQMIVIGDSIRTILDQRLPEQAYKYVGLYRGIGNEYHLRIAFAASDIDINSVGGQKPQIVSLALWNYDDGLTLAPQVFGGCGGDRITRKPDLNDPIEKFLAMKGVKIPFRKPKGELKNIYAAIERFCDNWLRLLKENVDVLTDQDVVNYKEFLGIN